MQKGNNGTSCRNRIKQLFCRHLWEFKWEREWLGDILIERITKKCHKCGKVLRGDWEKIGGAE